MERLSQKINKTSLYYIMFVHYCEQYNSSKMCAFNNENDTSLHVLEGPYILIILINVIVRMVNKTTNYKKQINYFFNQHLDNTKLHYKYLVFI